MAGKKRQSGERVERSWRLEDIQKLIDSLVEREISEFEMEQDGLRIRVRRGEASVVTPASLMTPTVVPVPVQAMVPQPAPAPPTTPAPALGMPPGGATPGERVPAEPAEGLQVVKSPIVGTFYRSASPKAEPFVKVGDAVRQGQVLCIIEAMKLMNEIESEVSGEVVRIYVENGQPVEYGQPLFAINPSAPQ